MIIDVRGTTFVLRMIEILGLNLTHFQANFGAAMFEKANMEKNAGVGQIAVKTQWLY